MSAGWRRRLSCGLCTVRMAGTLPGDLAGLDRLQTLVLSSNWLNSTLPPEWASGFAALEELHLNYNAFTCGRPTELILETFLQCRRRRMRALQARWRGPVHSLSAQAGVLW